MVHEVVGSGAEGFRNRGGGGLESGAPSVRVKESGQVWSRDVTRLGLGG